MIMSPQEIIREYREAFDRKKQINILADQNCCSRKEMAQFLYDHGQEIDKRLLAGKQKKTEQLPEPEAVPDQTVKKDAGKARLSLVPMQILYDIAAVREYGCMKYGEPDNWKKVEPSRYRDAMLRHMVEYIRDPASVDKESGLPHLWHLACNVAFLCEMEKEKE